MVKNLLFNAGEEGFDPWLGNQDPTRLQLLEPVCSRACTPQIEKPPCVTTRRKPTHHNEEPARCSEDPGQPNNNTLRKDKEAVVHIYNGILLSH